MKFKKIIFFKLIPLFVVLVFPLVNISQAEEIDPEKVIKELGYHSVKIGDDGKTPFYSYTKRMETTNLNKYENQINSLAKHEEVFKMCDFMRGGVKATLVEQTGIAYDVVVKNYGYSGSTIACVLKYIYQKQVGTQLIYSKKANDGNMYMVYLTD